MNGKRGTVVSVDNALGRVQVRIEGMDKSFKVKFENLQMATNEEEDEELNWFCYLTQVAFYLFNDYRTDNYL